MYVFLTWECSILGFNTILGNSKFISDFLGLREHMRIQKSKHTSTAPSKMESNIPTWDQPFTQKTSNGKESTFMIYYTQRELHLDITKHHRSQQLQASPLLTIIFAFSFPSDCLGFSNKSLCPSEYGNSEKAQCS